MIIQVYDLQHSSLQLLKRGLSVVRVCEAIITRVVTQPARPSRSPRVGTATMHTITHAHLVGFPHLNLAQACRS